VLAAVTFLALGVVLVGTFAVMWIIERSLRESARTSAAEEAKLLVEVGFAGASASHASVGPIKRVAAAQVGAARRAGSIIGVIAWSSRGRVVFAAPKALAAQPQRRPPRLVSRALETGERQTDSAAIAGFPREQGFAVVVPVLARSYVVEVLFSPAAEVATVAAAKKRLHWLAGAGGSVLYLALLPLLGWLADRVPRAEDRRRYAVIRDLERGLAGKELRLHYQPKVTMKGSHPLGVEALVRWEHPTRGLLSPADFVPLVEGSEALSALTVWVLQAATETSAQWRARGVNLPVAVNIAVPTLLGDRLVTDVRRALEASRLPATMLTLEITETAIMLGGEQAIRTLETLRASGARISLDEFGNGYSSLRRLGSLPVDELKIDRSFVSQLGNSERALRIVELIVNIGRSLGLTVVAEGVETAHELDRLNSLGCPFAQGYLFARPMPEDALLAWLAEAASAAL